MQSNARFYIIVAIVLVALGGLWFMIRGGKPAPEPTVPPKQTAKATQDEPKPQAEPGPVEVPDASPTGRTRTNQSSSSTTAQGEGTVTGTAKDDSGDPVAGATVIPAGASRSDHARTSRSASSALARKP